MATTIYTPGTVNQPFGLKPIRRLDGGVVGRGGQKYTIVNAYSSAIGLGDPVISTDTFQQNAGNGGTLISGREINIGATGDTFLGVFNGCSYQDNLGNFIWSKNWIASSSTLNSAGAQAFVYDDPQIVYQIQADAALTNAEIGEFITIATIGSPNTLGVSQAVAHVAGISSSITDLKILGLVVAAGLGNVATAVFPVLEVFIAKSEYRDPLSNG